MFLLIYYSIAKRIAHSYPVAGVIAKEFEHRITVVMSGNLSSNGRLFKLGLLVKQNEDEMKQKQVISNLQQQYMTFEELFGPMVNLLDS